MNELGILFLSLALAMALLGLLLFWRRPSRRWWFCLTCVAAAATLVVAVGALPFPWHGLL